MNRVDRLRRIVSASEGVLDVLSDANAEGDPLTVVDCEIALEALLRYLQREAKCVRELRRT